MCRMCELNEALEKLDKAMATAKERLMSTSSYENETNVVSIVGMERRPYQHPTVEERNRRNKERERLQRAKDNKRITRQLREEARRGK